MVSRDSFNPVAKTFHWVMAALIIGMVAVGLYMSDLPVSPQKFTIYKLHKATGMILLGLVALRLLWRMASPRPRPLPTHSPLEKFLATLVHIVLYGCMFLMPISGYVMSSAMNYPISIFGWFELPRLIAKNPALADFMKDVHETLGNVIIGAFALHVIGALKHHIIDKDATLNRMLPFNWGNRARITR
jgi:cytochrome b561